MFKMKSRKKRRNIKILSHEHFGVELESDRKELSRQKTIKKNKTNYCNER